VRLLALILAGFALALQYPLWFGKGGWIRVRELQQQVDAQKAITAKVEARTQAFDAEVRDLKTGFDALEERARSELGMIRQDELYFQLAPSPSAAAPATASIASTSSTLAAPPKK
jgi:cell division protein FtsB